jgi:hypothetical protein
MNKAIITAVLGITLLAGCSGTPQDKARWQAIGQASCSMSMNCDPNKYAATGNGWSPSYSNPATQSGLLIKLKSFYRYKGDTMCVYADGSITNIGTGVCPLNK